MQFSLLIPALVGVALLGGCAASPVAPFAAIAQADTTSSVPAASPQVATTAPSAAIDEEASPLASADRTDRPVPSRLAAVPGTVMVESAEDREENRRRQRALHRMITKRDGIVGDVVESR